MQLFRLSGFSRFNGSTRIFTWLSVIALLLAVSCSGKKPKLTDVDLEAWKKDRAGCNGVRRTMADKLIQQKDKLLSLDEMEVVDQLGKPDEHELYKRNQKFFYYNITPGRGCDTLSTGKRLVIRFNAVGLAKEIVVE